MAANAIRSSELTNCDVGEEVIVYGPGYVRMFTVASKTGEYVVLQRTGTEDGPDRVVCGAAVIPAGEVGINITPGVAFDEDRASVTVLNCDVPFTVFVNEEQISVDVETADVHDIEVLWQVFP